MCCTNFGWVGGWVGKRKIIAMNPSNERYNHLIKGQLNHTKKSAKAMVFRNVSFYINTPYIFYFYSPYFAFSWVGWPCWVTMTFVGSFQYTFFFFFSYFSDPTEAGNCKNTLIAVFFFRYKIPRPRDYDSSGIAIWQRLKVEARRFCLILLPHSTPLQPRNFSLYYFQVSCPQKRVSSLLVKALR